MMKKLIFGLVIVSLFTFTGYDSRLLLAEDGAAQTGEFPFTQNGLLQNVKKLPCEPNPPEGTDPAAGVSFDPDHMLCIQITMSPGDYALMAAESRFGINSRHYSTIWALAIEMAPQCAEPWPSDFNWYSGDIAVDGVVVEQVGIRKKGFLGSIFEAAPSFKIDTDYYVDGQFLGDTERLTLNNNSGDLSRMRTCLTYDVFTMAGYPAPRCNLANVMMNGNPLGAYTHVEAL
ncbi:MAG: CotH kinase family protein, partial [Anaerolineae bacterium]|nr:CotH kinase family protein [Anaerolineae bacterium]